MFEGCNFETFFDTHNSDFQEYVSSIITALSKKDQAYHTVNAEIDGIYGRYPKVFGVFDSEEPAALTDQECIALIKVLELRNQLLGIEMQAVYLRGCYDSIGYLKKAGIL